MNKKRLILVVDDELSIRKAVGSFITRAGYTSLEAADGEEALRQVEEANPDLIILDITMPKMNGLEVCRRIREWSQVPIIMLSAVMDQSSKVQALHIGADDYLAKPFDLNELLARIEAVLRRSSGIHTVPNEPIVASGDLSINFATRSVTLADQEISLTATEFNLLRELAMNRGKILTHGMLLHSIWGPEYNGETEYVRVFVNRLRTKIGDDPSSPKYIKTDVGVGYHFLS